MISPRSFRCGAGELRALFGVELVLGLGRGLDLVLGDHIVAGGHRRDDDEGHRREIVELVREPIGDGIALPARFHLDAAVGRHGRATGVRPVDRDGEILDEATGVRGIPQRAHDHRIARDDLLGFDHLVLGRRRIDDGRFAHRDLHERGVGAAVAVRDLVSDRIGAFAVGRRDDDTSTIADLGVEALVDVGELRHAQREPVRVGVVEEHLDADPASRLHLDDVVDRLRGALAWRASG